MKICVTIFGVKHFRIQPVSDFGEQVTFLGRFWPFLGYFGGLGAFGVSFKSGIWGV